MAAEFALTKDDTIDKKFEIVVNLSVIHFKCHMTEQTDGRSFILSKKVRITNELGLHARAAAIIARIAQTATSTIWIAKENEKVDAASIIDILTLECTKGSWVTLESGDPSDHNVLLEIVKSIKSGFGE